MSGSKILTHEQLLRLRADARQAGRRVVQCHGCFDIVHPGHVRHLRFAKQLGDILLVTITADESISKGAGRPLIPEELRADNLAALDFVDWVHIEHRPTAASLLEEVRPDIYVKGREYEFNNDPRFQAERDAVERHQGRVVFSSGDVVFSSTALIAALEQSADPFHAHLRDLLSRDEAQGTALSSLVSSFRGRRVIIVGETILDTYVLCDRPDIAGESPIMTLRPSEYRHYDGGAAIIARHVAALGGRPTLITPFPSSGPGLATAIGVKQRLLAEGVDLRPLSIESALPEKQRFLVGAQKVMKLDLVDRMVVDAAMGDRLIDLASAAAAESPGAAVIVADFGLGLFSPALMRRLCRALRPLASVMAGDVSGRRSNLMSMTGMDLICPSESEARDAIGLHDQGLPAVTWRLLERTASQRAIITMGPDGLIVFNRLQDVASARKAAARAMSTSSTSSAAGLGPTGGSGHGERESRESPGARDPRDISAATEPDTRPGAGDGWARRLDAQHIPALCPFAIDPLGCGDALLTTATLSLASGGSSLAAGLLGAIAAGVQAQRLGNLPVSATDLRHAIARLHAAHLAYAPADVVESRASRPAPRPAVAAAG